MLMNQFAEQAEAMADPVIQLKNSFGDLLESLMIRDVVLKVAEALRGVADVIALLPPNVLRGIGAALVALFAVFTAGAVLAGIMAIIPAIISATVAMWGYVAAATAAVIASAPFIAIGIAIVAALAAVGLAAFALWKNWDTVWGFIKKGFEAVANFLSGVFRSKWAWLLPGGAFIKAILFLRDHWDKVWDGMKVVIGAVGSSVKATVGVITNVVKAMINGLITGLNFLIRGLNKVRFEVPSWVPKLGGKGFGINIPEIPKLAEGGIVSQPTVAMIGERGPEAVIPLGRAGAGVGGPNIIINLEGPTFLDNEASTRRLSDFIARRIDTTLRSRRAF